MPVFFLAVANACFRFAVTPRPGAYEQDESEKNAIEADLEKVTGWLQAALETIGCGGKTAVGYGRFEAPEKTSSSVETWKNATIRGAPGSGKITATGTNSAKTAVGNSQTDSGLKAFVENLSNRKKKLLKGQGIVAQAQVSVEGNRCTLLSIELKEEKNES